MITDKDREDAKSYLEKLFSGKTGTGSWHGINDKWSEQELIEMQAERDSRIRAESANQARKEAAEIAVAFVDNNMTGLADCDIGLLTDLRAAILGDSVVKESLITDHIPDTGKKLVIAVNALKKISKGKVKTANGVEYLTFGNVIGISDRALKEIQG